MIERQPHPGCVPDGAQRQALHRDLLALREEIVTQAASTQHWIDQIHLQHRDSARNLLHHLALRRRDLRPLQQRLAELGLSSLGGAEAHVLASLEAVLAMLAGPQGE